MYNLDTRNVQVKTVFLPTEKPLTSDTCAPLIATLPLEVGLIPLHQDFACRESFFL